MSVECLVAEGVLAAEQEQDDDNNGAPADADANDADADRAARDGAGSSPRLSKGQKRRLNLKAKKAEAAAASAAAAAAGGGGAQAATPPARAAAGGGCAQAATAAAAAPSWTPEPGAAEPTAAPFPADESAADGGGGGARPALSRAGAVPNLYLGASARGDRRALGRALISLPHPSRLALPPLPAAAGGSAPSILASAAASPAVAPYTRQGSDLWRALRGGGLLTTARFADALGLREPRASASLGVTGHLVGHEALVRACRHLSAAAEAPAPATTTTTGGEAPGGQGAAAAAAAATPPPLRARSAAEARRLNARALWDANFGPDAGAEGDSTTEEGEDEDSEDEGEDEDGAKPPPQQPPPPPQQQQRQNPATTPASPADAPLQSRPPPLPARASRRQRRRRRRRDAASLAAAANGPVGVAMAWGLAQEGASLWELSRVFPRSLIEESGLHLVDARALRRRAGGAGRRAGEAEGVGDKDGQAAAPEAAEAASAPPAAAAAAAAAAAGPLPPMGASPDAIVAHVVRLTPGSARGLLRQWRARLPPSLAEALARAAAAEAAQGGEAGARRLLWADAAPAFLAADGNAARLAAQRMWHDALRLVSVADDSTPPASEGGEQEAEAEAEAAGGGGAKSEGRAVGAAAAARALAAELAAAAHLLEALLSQSDPRRAFARRLGAPAPPEYDEDEDGGGGGSDGDGDDGDCGGGENGDANRGGSGLASCRAAYRAALLAAAAAAVGDGDGDGDGSDGDPHESSGAGGDGSLPCCCFVRRRRQFSADGPSADPAPASAPAPGASIVGALILREAVEVKNASPFRSLAKKAKGKPHRFLLSDPGPRDSLLPLWVPQAQLHALATGLPSALLAHRSATRGCRVWRVPLDGAWTARALALVGRLMARHVLPPGGGGSPPPPAPPPHDCFFDESGYGPFLAHTRRVAAGAALVAATRGSGGLDSSGEDEGEDEGGGGGGGGRWRRRARWPADADRRAFVDSVVVG